MARKPDCAHRMTDKELDELERRISAIYQEARNSLDETVRAYFESFRKRDEKMKKLIGTIRNGREWTEQDYINWRLDQIGRGERFQALRDKVAERMTKANETATAYVNDATPGIYSLNRNYAAYTIEQATGDVGFDLWDEQTVKRLIVEQPGLMPYYPPKRALRRGIDLAWGKKQITACVTSSILQGKSIKGMADDLQTRIPEMNRASAIRTARTAVTGAQNAGRMDSYHAAEKMGIRMKKEWLATLDNRTRHAHAMLDGQQADVDKPFKVDGEEIRFPGDPTAAGYLVYNCRCTLIAAVDGVDTSDALRKARNQETSENKVIGNMSYAEWAGWKKRTNPVESITKSDIIKESPKPLQYRQFESGEAANEFFYYDDEKRGLTARKNSEHGKWMKSLSSDEKDSISDYTGGGYYDLNNYLRKVGDWKSVDAEKEEFLAKNIDSAISRYKLKDNIQVQRGVMEDALDSLIEQYGDDISGLIGKTYRDSGYMSTTVLHGNPVATVKPVIFEIEVPAGTGRGAYVNQLAGQYQDAEYEFLIRRNASFLIKGIEEDADSGKMIIKMVMNDE